MSYATIALHLDAHAGLDGLIDQGARLARKFESRLVGIAAADLGLFGLGAATARLVHADEKGGQTASRRAQRFERRLSGLAHPISFEAVVDDDDVVTALVRRSACCDLLVLAQADPAWQTFARSREQLEQVVLESAAPTLVLPTVMPVSVTGEHPMIAWDGSHGAARAVAGALPMLQRARRVHLVRCEPEMDIDRGAEADEFDLPRGWLGRHGVRVEASLERTGASVGATLLSRARSLGADMIVMGAWGMPRWAERLVGGTTRTMLADMDIPVLMAH